MNPQVKVIADFPGNKDFEIGSTLTLEPYNQYYWKYEVKDCQGERIYLLEFFEKYPYLFEIVGREKAKQPAPTIGARWVMLTPDNIPATNWDKIHFRYSSDKKVMTSGMAWVLIEGGRHNEIEYLFDSPATFPTREQAQEWVNIQYPEWDHELSTERKVSMEMYDWIVQQMAQKSPQQD
ncbi:MAG: hypothetical protein ACK40M_04265 [Flavobacteriales bacterium]